MTFINVPVQVLGRIIGQADCVTSALKASVGSVSLQQDILLSIKVNFLYQLNFSLNLYKVLTLRFNFITYFVVTGTTVSCSVRNSDVHRDCFPPVLVVVFEPDTLSLSCLPAVCPRCVLLRGTRPSMFTPLSEQRD